MYLRKNRSLKKGRTYLSIIQGYRDKDGKSRNRTIMKIGFLDELQEHYENPIAHFEDVAKQLTLEYEEKTQPIKLDINRNEVMSVGTQGRKNFGHVVFSSIYHELGLDYFINSRRRHTKTNYNHNAIFKMLVYSRLLFPASKKKSFEMKNMFFDKMDFCLDDVYRSLSFFTKFKDDLLLALHKRVTKLYGRDTSLVYYDVTNYYFEIDKSDEMRKKGVSKEHRPNPIVQMGLFMDTGGLPLNYGLFPGNTLDKKTLIPMIGKIRKDYNLSRIIVVADRGMMAGDNIRQILIDKNGYVLSYSIRGAEKAFQNYVLDQKGYREVGEDGFRIKSRIYPREITVSNLKGKKTKVRIDEKQVVFFSPKYGEKAKADRMAAVEKAERLVSSPAAYARAATYGAARYIRDEPYSPENGEILQNVKHLLSFNANTLADEEKFDGYYAIVSSELDMDEQKILSIYRGLWKIEESFKITKSDLETRPVYLSRQDHIKAHFLICFVSLFIARLLEKKLNGKYAIPSILESLNNCGCSRIDQNIYLFDYYDELLAELGKVTGIDFSRKYRIAGEVKKIFAYTKK